jgi:hypothetical protein
VLNNDRALIPFAAKCFAIAKYIAEALYLIPAEVEPGN